FWDRLSLYFVFFGMGERAIDRAPGADGEATITLRQVGPREATADPWPFDRPVVACPVVVARVPDRRYASGEEFLRVLVDAPHDVWDYTLRRP
ncbi:MAG: DUF3891 family protein, partial [Chloroflexi bacterium]|nr:DUF3891 family protein [Chloroflexota bacterium]